MTKLNADEARALVERLTGYTPEPWTFEMEQDEWPDHALIGGDGDTVLSFDFDLGFGVHDANARLIGAAPDLHRHLTAALDDIERRDAKMNNRLAYQVRVAVRKTLQQAEIDSILIQARAEGRSRGVREARETDWNDAIHAAIHAVRGLDFEYTEPVLLALRDLLRKDA